MNGPEMMYPGPATRAWTQACLGPVPALILLLTGFLPAGDTPVSYRLAAQAGRTVITASTGEVLPWACYSLGPDLSIEEWGKKQAPMAKAGIHLYQLNLQGASGHFRNGILLAPITGRLMAQLLLEGKTEFRLEPLFSPARFGGRSR